MSDTKNEFYTIAEIFNKPVEEIDLKRVDPAAIRRARHSPESRIVYTGVDPATDPYLGRRPGVLGLITLKLIADAGEEGIKWSDLMKEGGRSQDITWDEAKGNVRVDEPDPEVDAKHKHISALRRRLAADGLIFAPATEEVKALRKAERKALRAAKEPIIPKRPKLTEEEKAARKAAREKAAAEKEVLKEKNKAETAAFKAEEKAKDAEAREKIKADRAAKKAEESAKKKADRAAVAAEKRAEAKAVVVKQESELKNKKQGKTVAPDIVQEPLLLGDAAE